MHLYGKNVQNFKRLLLWSLWANFAQISCGASLSWGNERLLKWSRLVDPRWLPCPYMVKTFKNFLLHNRGCLGAESLHKPSGTGGILTFDQKLFWLEILRWPSSCLYLLYFPATVLFTCIKSWFFRNHLANFHQISHWSYCWNVIDSLFKWLCSIDRQAHIFFFKTKNCSNDDLFIGCYDRIGKMLHNICISAVVMSLRWASRGRGPLVFLSSMFV